TMVERSDQITRSVTFKNKPDLLKKIKKAIASDKEYAVSKSLVTDNGEISESIVISNEEEEIKIGLNNSKSKEVYFFVRIVPRNNRSNSRKSSNITTKTKHARRAKRTTRAKRTSKARKALQKNSDEFIFIDDNTYVINL
ncbi:MAG: hypothetical protein K2H22_06540, partial [Muribaculaceae bacterium]|nr:hypothetical protein [Muribaculaceae bacterium]